MLGVMHLERRRSGRLPYLAAGAGPPLAFLAGVAPDAGADSWATRVQARDLVGPFAAYRRVAYFNRRPGLPPGLTMAGLAAEQAEALRGLGQGPVDVAGISTGGSIALQVAADHPDVVRRLVVISAACRLGPEGRAQQRREAARIRAGARRRAFAVMTAGLVPPGRGRTAAGVAGFLLGPLVFPDRGQLADMATTLEAEDVFDLAASPPIRAPTLIVAGGRDRFYTQALFAETADLIPGSRLRILPRRGHVTVTEDPGFARAIRGFLTA
jgi:pimeloyl-ACP methyl ester carboxylesterase